MFEKRFVQLLTKGVNICITPTSADFSPPFPPFSSGPTDQQMAVLLMRLLRYGGGAHKRQLRRKTLKAKETLIL